ncbi:hypothetical protein [Tsukamurella hominis]|uniref:hypothetical protein n=1 Tax=Tsukamurella hominis TaxID=1970232 RepID=UPI0039E8B915
MPVGLLDREGFAPFGAQPAAPGPGLVIVSPEPAGPGGTVFGTVTFGDGGRLGSAGID